MSNLDAILAAARSQAQNLPATAGLPAPADAGVGGGMPAVGGGFGAPALGLNTSVDAFLNPGGMECESYVQVRDSGIKLNKEWTGQIDEFEAILDTRDVQFFYGIRKEVGSTVTYAKSYDGVTTPRGENFAAIVEEFKRTSQKPADIYRGADIPLELTGAYADPKKAANSYDAGTVVGLSTSITGFKPFASFMRKLAQAGINGRVKVKATHSPRKNGAGQPYGVIEWDVLEVLDQPAAAAA